MANVKELRDTAKKLNISGYSKMKKAELEVAIAEAEKKPRVMCATVSSPTLISQIPTPKEVKKNSRFLIVRCKREDYIKAWISMYKTNKKVFNEDPLYKDVNPAANKTPLASETDNYCVVAYDTEQPTEGFEYGRPVGLFCFVITPSKNIGKQFVVHPDYARKGLGKALLIENEKVLKELGFTEYYIGCSHCSAGILKGWGYTPYSSDDQHDMYKFIVDLTVNNFQEQYDAAITNNPNIDIIK